MITEIVNPKDIQQLISSDKTFAHINKTYGSPPNWTRPQGFITLCKIILEQQVSLASANAHFLKLNAYINEFTPSEILKLSDEEMKNCFISRQKSAYLRALSIAVLNGNLDLKELPALTYADIRKQLISVKGIGEWTADIYLMFCLKAKDIFPIGDIAMMNTIKELTGAKTKEEIIFMSHKWKPLRSLATYFFWHYYLKKRERTIII